MLKDRGYIVNFDKEEESLDDFKKKYGESSSSITIIG